jgi:hypothetical protein
MITRYLLSFNHGTVSFVEKLKGLFVISGLRGLILTAKSSSSVSVSSFVGNWPLVIASRELIRLFWRASFCIANREEGGLWATALAGRDEPP